MTCCMKSRALTGAAAASARPPNAIGPQHPGMPAQVAQPSQQQSVDCVKCRTPLVCASFSCIAPHFRTLCLSVCLSVFPPHKALSLRGLVNFNLLFGPSSSLLFFISRNLFSSTLLDVIRLFVLSACWVRTKSVQGVRGTQSVVSVPRMQQAFHPRKWHLLQGKSWSRGGGELCV